MCRDYDGRTALHLAAAEGHTHCVQFLVAGCGVSPLLRDRWGFTPLVEAARFHHTPLVELLLEHVRQKMGQVTSWDTMEVVTVHCNGALCRPSTSRAARWWPGSRRRREPGSWSQLLSSWSQLLSSWSQLLSSWSQLLSCRSQLVSCWLQLVGCWSQLVTAAQ